MRHVPEVRPTELEFLNFVKKRHVFPITRLALMETASVETLWDHLRDQLLVGLQVELLERERDHATWDVIEPWVYASWQDHLLHSLPPESFRYRFLHYLLGRHPEMRRKRHEVTARAADEFPESTLRIARVHGQPHVAVDVSSHSYYEEAS